MGILMVERAAPEPLATGKRDAPTEDIRINLKGNKEFFLQLLEAYYTKN